MTTEGILFTEKQPVCPFCGSLISRDWLSDSGKSEFVSYECGLELVNLSSVLPRVWKMERFRHRDCVNVYRVVLEFQRSVP